MIARFTVPGPPQGKGRPRFSGNGHAYTPSATVQYERQIQRAYKQQCGTEVFAPDEPLVIKIAAYYNVPQSDSKRRRSDKLANRIRPTKKPDWDNIGKVVCDALNGLAYKDDAQIVDARVVKVYGEFPRVEVFIDKTSV